jgi:hypothetical protein
MYRRLTVSPLPPALRQGLLVDQTGLPRYWAAVWAVLKLSDAAISSRERKLRFLESLYAHADEIMGPGALDTAIHRIDDARLAAILESWFVSIVNKSPGTPNDEARWRVGFEFVSNTVTWLQRHQPRVMIYGTSNGGFID